LKRSIHGHGDHICGHLFLNSNFHQ
jgi:hypothetical protein